MVAVHLFPPKRLQGCQQSGCLPGRISGTGTTMSLVIAFIGAHGAVMGGDRREIITSGERIPTETLEHELYGGQIVTDEALVQRAGELGVSLTIRDDKRKVSQRDGILVGEVSETEGGITRKRRLYATAGEYALAEITGDEIRLTGKGKASNFVVLGNEVAKQVVHTCIREKWKNGTMHDAIRIIMIAMERAFEASASVSGLYDLIQTPVKASISEVIERDSGYPS
jgi:hypothetical protein